MTRTFFVGGNWKCNGTSASNKKLCEAWSASTDGGAKYTDKPVEIVIAPPALYALSTKALLPANFEAALQNCWTGGGGAYTGEISADMLADAGVPWVVLGHSERRALPVVKESDETIATKTAYAISKGVKVIACIGETLEEREAGQTLLVNERQLKAIGAVLSVADWANVVVAYEPVWAIGTGKVATPEQAQEVHAFLRKWLKENVSEAVGEATRIIYGGSVKPGNAKELAGMADIDGFLVGGASLKPDFTDIIDAYEVQGS
jgi:triosephosphate isomerase (TIM)